MPIHEEYAMKSVSDPRLDEELSACMDGELERSKYHFAIKRLVEQPEASRRWARYHLIRATIKKEGLAGHELASRVAAALREAPVIQVQPTPPRWLKSLAGAAIAATVAVVAVMGMNRTMMVGPLDPSLDSERGFVSQATPLDRVFSQPATPVNFPDPNDRERLQRLMLQHQQASRGAGVGVYWPVMGVPAVETLVIDPASPSARSDDGLNKP